MFIQNKSFLPFFNSESGASGKTDEKLADEFVKDKTDKETDDFAAKIEKDLEESRAKVFASESDEEIKLGKKSSVTDPPVLPAKTEGVITLNDDFIKGAETNEMFKGLDKTAVSTILGYIKDTQVDAKVLKNYVHGQVKLEEYNRTKDPKALEDQLDDGFGNISDRTEEDYAESLEQLDDKDREQIDQAKQMALYNKLKVRYKDITLDDLKDEDSLNSYVATLQVNKPMLADDFKVDFKSVNKQIDKDASEYVDRAVNFGDYMRKDAKEVVDKFTAKLQAKGIDPKELETDFTEKWLVNNIVKKADGKLNTDIITYYRGKIPTLNKTVFLQAIEDKFDSRITELTKKAGINEFIEGKRKKDANPSISNSPAGGRQRIDDPNPTEISTKEFPGFEAIDKTLALNRKKIFESGDGVYPE